MMAKMADQELQSLRLKQPLYVQREQEYEAIEAQLDQQKRQDAEIANEGKARLNHTELREHTKIYQTIQHQQQAKIHTARLKRNWQDRKNFINEARMLQAYQNKYSTEASSQLSEMDA